MSRHVAHRRRRGRTQPAPAPLFQPEPDDAGGRDDPGDPTPGWLVAERAEQAPLAARRRPLRARLESEVKSRLDLPALTRVRRVEAKDRTRLEKLLSTAR